VLAQREALAGKEARAATGGSIPHKHGSRLTAAKRGRLLEKYLAQAGLDGGASLTVSATLRDAFALDRGADIRSVQELLGHRSLTTPRFTPIDNESAQGQLRQGPPRRGQSKPRRRGKMTQANRGARHGPPTPCLTNTAARRLLAAVPLPSSAQETPAATEIRWAHELRHRHQGSAGAATCPCHRHRHGQIATGARSSTKAPFATENHRRHERTVHPAEVGRRKRKACWCSPSSHRSAIPRSCWPRRTNASST